MQKHLQKLLLVVAMLVVPWVVQAQTHYTIQVGSGTETSPYVPDYGYYNYSYTQAIYTAGEVGLDGVIDTLAFQVDNGGLTRTLNIYMAEVSRTSFSSTSDAVGATNFHLVYSGSVAWTTGWVTIALDSTFTYQDSGSLVIAVIDQTGSYSSGYPYYAGTTMSNNRSLYAYNDNNSYSLTSTLTSTTSFLPNIRLGISSTSEYCATPSDLAASDLVNDEATISWTENGGATSWELIVSDTAVTNFSDWSPITTSATTYALSGLTGNTLYYVYVRALCSSTSISAWSNVMTFRSACMGSTAVPYSTGFEDLTTGEMPNCWLLVQSGSSSASTFPSAYVYPTNARNSNVYFEFESSHGETEVAALPVMDNINTLFLSFYASVMNTNFTLEVGVMEDDTVFVPVDTVALTAGVGNNWSGSYYPYTVYFNDYMGNGDRIALRVTPTSNNYTLMMDDFVVDEIPNCLPPTRFRVDSIGADWAVLGWHEVGEAYEWEVIYDTLLFNPDTTTLMGITAFDTSIVLNNLVFENTYYAYVRANCGDYSPWVGPLEFVPGQFVMRPSGSDTIRTCGFTIFDDGGQNGEYNVGTDFTLVVYPSSDDSVVTFWGNTDLYVSYAHLRIYEGVGLNGALLWQSTTGNYTDVIPLTRSNVGPITVRFTAGSYNYGYTGFVLHTGCEAAPACAVVQNVTVSTVGTSSAHVSWNVAGTNFGVPSGYEVECQETATNVVAYTGTATTTRTTILGLTANTEYKVRVRAVCDNNAYGSWDSTYLTTSRMPCMVYDTALHDSVTISGLNASTSYYYPVNNYYRNSYTQQIVLSEEMGGSSTVINGIDFQYAYSSPNTYKTHCAIYLANTDVSSLASSFVAYDTTFHMVYNGPLVCNTGWNHFDFSTPFVYDGSKNLLIIVIDSSNDYNGSSYTFNTHSTSNLSRYMQTDGSYYDITNIYLTNGSVGSSRNNMRLHVAGCSMMATCARPTVTVDTVTYDMINLSWAPGYQETSWSVEYKAEGDSVWIDEGSVSTPSYSFTMLNSDTRYLFRIGSICTDTTMTTELAVRTTCIPDTIPFSYGFETFTSTSGQPAPSCWFKGTNYSSYEYPLGSNSYAHSGSQSLYFYSYSDIYNYVALPVFAAPVDSLEVSFWLYTTYASDYSTIAVGVMTDPENINTFTQVATVTVDQSYVWKPFHVRFNTYSGSGTNIAFKYSDGDYYSLYLDDITVDYIRPCPRLENVTLLNVTTDSAIFTWDGDARTSFEIEYGPSGFTHDSGTFVHTTVDTVILAGLTPNTAYDFYVRSFCDDGDTSSWSNAYSFRTDCLKLTALPYFEDFESVPPGMGSSYSTDFVPCWTRSIDPDDSYYYPYIDTWGGYSGSNYIYWYWSSYNYFDPWITLPEIDTNVLSIDSLQLNFWAYNSSADYSTPRILVGVMANPSQELSFQVIDTIEITSDDWALYEIPLNNYTGHGASHIALKAMPPAGNTYWYAYIDDVTLDYIPSCPHVDDIAMTANTPTSVTMGWTERGNATNWEVAIDSVATAIPIADTIVSGTPSVTFSGLTSAQYYYVWVRAVCGAGDTSEWAGPAVAIPNSWNMRANQTDTIYMCGGMVFDDGGPLGRYAKNQSSTLVIMPVDTNWIISLSGEGYTDYSYDYITIYDGVGSTGLQRWNDYGEYSTTFGPIESYSGPLTITFQSDNYTQYDGFSIEVNCLTTHCRVMGVQLNPAVPASGNQLSLIWNNNGAMLYQVEYGATGFTQGTGTMLTTTTNSITITGLTQLGIYDVYLRSICGVGDTGAWVLHTYQTAICEGETHVEDYDASMSTTTSYYGPIGYSLYNNSFVQTIIDSAHLAGLDGDITAFAFSPNNVVSGSYFTNMTVYLANVSEDNLSSAFITPDSNHQFVKVLDSANLCFTTTGWQPHAFDTAFTWDGHSNLLLTVKRDHGSYSSSNSFDAHNTTGARTRYCYSDVTTFDINTVNSSGVYSYTQNLVGDVRFYSCGTIACPQPVITNETHDYESVTLTWTGTSNTYEVNIKEASAAVWSVPDITVTGNTYAFTALQPATEYTYRVRQDCDSLGYSDWTEGTFVTDSLPCLPPDSLTVTGITNVDATFDWQPFGYETMWEVRVWNTAGFDNTNTVTTHPVVLGGFTAGVTYNASVRPLCGTAHNILGDWGDTVTFTAATCPDVTGLTAGGVQPNSLTLSWTNNPAAESWVIEYGFTGFEQGTGTQAVSTTPTYVVTGLLEETGYDFYVRAMCDDNWYSENWAHVTATTPYGGVICDAPTGVNAVVAGNAATISWTAGTGNLNYELEYGPHGFAHGTGMTQSATASPVTVSNLNYETQYDVYVRAFCENNASSAWSAVTSFTTEAQGSEDCDPVTNLTATEITENSAVISWTAGATGDEWEVVLTDADGTTLSEARTHEQSYQLNGLTPGTAYIVKVRTVCGDDQYSDYASTSFTTISVGIDGVAEASCAIYPNPTSSAT
ncbi:MAG: fibronectin type III domain-containing protein, partial [Bacteroidales bacterium]|nr:fibronectin type III domain-containing protein [Bacteroidales bacterium]